MRHIKELKLFLLSSVLTFSSMLFGVYANGETFHEVRNGLPLPIIIQKIKTNPATLVGLELKPFNLFIDLLFWLFLLYLIDLRKKLKYGCGLVN